MSARVEIRGLTEFRAALRQLPDELTDEAGAIVLAHAEEAKRRAQTAYPEGPTGNLRRGVTMEQHRSKLTSSALVRSRAKHAWLFDHGSGPRRTDRGVNRGRMPQAPEAQRFVPIAIRVRRNMVKALVGLVRRAGFQVDEP